MKTTPVHQRMETLTETDTQEYVYPKPLRDVDELKQHLIETWSFVCPKLSKYNVV